MRGPNDPGGDASGGPIAPVRRVVIARLLAAAAAVLCGWRTASARGLALPTGEHARGDVGSQLSASDQRLMLLGARFTTETPRLARMLAQDIARHLTSWRGGDASAADLARRARAWFLDPDRLKREFARGEVLSIDGWLLARSEVAVAVYLHSIAGDPDDPSHGR